MSHPDSEIHAIRTRTNSALKFETRKLGSTRRGIEVVRVFCLFNPCIETEIAGTDHGKMRDQGFNFLTMGSDASSFNSLTW